MIDACTALLLSRLYMVRLLNTICRRYLERPYTAPFHDSCLLAITINPLRSQPSSHLTCGQYYTFMTMAGQLQEEIALALMLPHPEPSQSQRSVLRQTEEMRGVFHQLHHNRISPCNPSKLEQNKLTEAFLVDMTRK